MRALWITLLPMLVVAALVLWGGERLARRTVEERIPADRGRLLDFTEAFRGEVDRLDEVYLGHMDDLATSSTWMSAGDFKSRCENLVGVRSCQIFEADGSVKEVEGTKPRIGEAAMLPSVVAEGEEGRLVSRKVMVLPKEAIEGAKGGSGWLAAADGIHRAYWRRTAAKRVVAFVIDDAELTEQLKSHLAAWAELPLNPLREAGELMAVEGPRGSRPVTMNDGAHTGPAALVIPHRGNLGKWQVLAWDKLETTATHDTATLVIACGIATVLLLAGVLLQIQQGRALKLAEERVSFVNRVSHELGTPLTNILLNLDLASRALDERPAESRRRLALVNEEVQRLGRLVSNVLTFSRGERKTLELRVTACSPDEVVEGVLAQFQPSLERRKVSVEWQRGAPERVKLDPDALAQIAGNLISNVEKYASAGGWLGIETVVVKDRLRLRVSDRGPGIPPRQRERIFEAFERVHREVSEGSSGTGLGLAIARDLARRMQGDLRLIATNSGCCFELDLPAPVHLAVVSKEPAA